MEELVSRTTVHHVCVCGWVCVCVFLHARLPIKCNTGTVYWLFAHVCISGMSVWGPALDNVITAPRNTAWQLLVCVCVRARACVCETCHDMRVSPYQCGENGFVRSPPANTAHTPEIHLYLTSLPTHDTFTPTISRSLQGNKHHLK